MALEAVSARVAGALDARPALGSIWRRIVCIMEASATLSMEDVPVPVQDLLGPAIGSAITGPNPQAAHVANRVQRFLLRPGSFRDTPESVFDRAIAAGTLLDIVDENQGGRIAYRDAHEQTDLALARTDFAAACRRILKHDSPITFRLIALAGLTRNVLPEAIPIAERLIFMAAESEMRQQDMLSDLTVGAVGREADFRMTAHWTLTPALALSRGGFRAWSPGSTEGADLLVARLENSLRANAGLISTLHRWLEALDGFSGMNRKSRKRDLAALLIDVPILGADTVAHRLSITERAARDLLAAAELEGLISLVTPRRAYRLWAIPALAAMISDRAHHATPHLEQATARRPIGLSQPSPEESDTQEVMDLDAAIALADQVLERYRRDAVSTSPSATS